MAVWSLISEDQRGLIRPDGDNCLAEETYFIVAGIITRIMTLGSVMPSQVS